MFIIGYGLGRFWIEGLRIDPADELAGLRWNQWVALAAVVGGAIALFLIPGDDEEAGGEPGLPAGAADMSADDDADVSADDDADLSDDADV